MTQASEQEATHPWDAAQVNLTSQELAPGVFAVMSDNVFTKDHVATTAGFVIGERSVLVVESMLNGDLASQLIGLVRQATTKPIPLPRQHELPRRPRLRELPVPRQHRGDPAPGDQTLHGGKFRGRSPLHDRPHGQGEGDRTRTGARR